jgi:hypothetical protein
MFDFDIVMAARESESCRTLKGLTAYIVEPSYQWFQIDRAHLNPY